jgi:hypothetical protein
LIDRECRIIYVKAINIDVICDFITNSWIIYHKLDRLKNSHSYAFIFQVYQNNGPNEYTLNANSSAASCSMGLGVDYAGNTYITKAYLDTVECQNWTFDIKEKI